MRRENKSFLNKSFKSKLYYNNLNSKDNNNTIKRPPALGEEEYVFTTKIGQTEGPRVKIRRLQHTRSNELLN